MKKLALPILMLLSLVACKKETPVFTFVLTNQHVKVKNLSEDYLVQVNNSDKTVYIEVAYADKPELNALSVELANLPSDVTASPASFTFNFSSGAALSDTLTQGELKEIYKITAAAAKPDPHFVSVKLNGRDVSGGVAKFKKSDAVDFTHVGMEFVVSPANTIVKIGDEEITSYTEEAPNAIDFSDKMNGVTFSLVCEDVTNKETIKVATTGINTVNRVWGRYIKPVTAGANPWPAEIPSGTGTTRTMAMDKGHIYLATTGKQLYALDIKDVSVTKMDMGDYAAGGLFGSCALACMEDGNGGHVILLSNLVNSLDSEFVIWKWDAFDGKPTKVLSYKLPEAARIGDQMTVEGTWKEGKIWFHDFTSQRAAFVFTVKDGVISNTATKVTYDAKQGNWGAMYKYDDTQYIGGGPGSKSRLFTIENNVATTQLELESKYFAYPLHGIRFFTFNEQEYMTYAVLRNNWQDGQMRITELNGETLKASLENPTVNWKFWLGDPEIKDDITADKNGNGCGNNCLVVIDNVIHIASYVPGAGVSLFTIE